MQTIYTTKIFHFAAAHALTKYHGKCEHLHGHNYKLEITVKGPVFDNGLSVDFGILKKIVNEKILAKLDHKNLNDIFENPSAENITIWIWNQLENFHSLLKDEQKNPNIPEDLKKWINADEKEIKKDIKYEGIELYKIKLWETEDSYVIYRG